MHILSFFIFFPFSFCCFSESLYLYIFITFRTRKLEYLNVIQKGLNKTGPTCNTKKGLIPIMASKLECCHIIKKYCKNSNVSFQGFTKL